jgi:hypothetical protein
MTSTHVASRFTIRTTRFVLIKQAIRDLGYDEKYVAPRATQSAISSAKNRGEDPTRFAARAEYQDERRAIMAKVYEMYEARLHGNNALDFDDLLIKTVRLLRDVDEVREKYNNKFRYILVDEYQDTNSLQLRSSACSLRRRRTSRSSATKISRSTSGAARTSATSSTSRSIFRNANHSSRTKLSLDADDSRRRRARS